MRRVLIASIATVAGVVGLLNYRVAPHPAAVATGPADGSVANQPVTQPGAAPTPTPAAAASGTFTGQAVDVRYGYVQVKVIVAGGRITDVQAVQLPGDRARSAYISQYAGPVLRSEALAAQSARIDVVSGATYTSDGYSQSLSSALQQAGVAG